jgi:hypothetical protein
MDPLVGFWIFLIGMIAGVLLALILISRTAIKPMHQHIQELTDEQHTISIDGNTIPEPYQSYLKKYPYDLKRFRFIHHPITGIQFEKNMIFFVNIPAKQQSETEVIEHIKKLVETKRVQWYELSK